MEALILIPIALIIYGWMKTIPATEPPEGANGFDFTWSNCEQDEDFDFDSDSSQISCCDARGSSFSSFDENDDWSTRSLTDDLMFDVANSWCSFNIYHDDIHTTNMFDDPFNSVFDDGMASFHSFDN